MPRSGLKAVTESIDCRLDPVDVFRSIKSRPYSFFLDSACDAKKLGRFSIIGCDPFLVFRSKGESIELKYRDGRARSLKGNPFPVIKNLLKKYEITGGPGQVPFTCGAVGYFAYDMKDFIEDLPDNSKDDLNTWDCVLGFYDSAIIYDNLKRRYYISSINLKDKCVRHSEVNLKAFLETRYPEEKLACLPSKLLQVGRRGIKNTDSSALPGLQNDGPNILRQSSGCLKSNFSKRSYASVVKKAKEYIKSGDIYQVNISQRFQTKFCADPFDLYLRLRSCSPAPFASYLNFGDTAILSSSPERFLLKRGDRIETRPVKGTRPRGKDSAHDRALKLELEKSDKDMAEHIMIVDLERNDLGRICEYGSIYPTESVITEKYSNVVLVR